MMTKPKVRNVFLFANGQMAVFDAFSKPIPELQGEDTPERRAAIAAQSDEHTEMFGGDLWCIPAWTLAASVAEIRALAAAAAPDRYWRGIGGAVLWADILRYAERREQAARTPCDNPACRGGRVRRLECGPLRFGAMLDIGTPDSPGPDLRMTWTQCPVCRKAAP